MEYALLAIRILLVLLGAMALIRFVWKSSWRNILAWFAAVICSLCLYYELISFMGIFSEYASAEGYRFAIEIVASLSPLLAYLPLIRYSAMKRNGQFSNEIILLVTAISLFVAFICYVVGSYLGIFGAVVSVLTMACFSMYSDNEHKRNITKVNEQMLNAQLNHYETIKQSNFELRRIKHDMKNHLLVARDMAEKGNNKELIAYLDTLTDEVVKGDVFCRTGNDIADAILSDKNNKAAKRNITLQVSGDLAGVEIDDVGLCTIIANLLDNAIEAVSKLYNLNTSERHKVITIDFRKNANFLVIEQTNYSLEKIKSEKGRFITSKNSPDHGFGLYNIKQAVYRNDGEFNIIEDTGEFTKYTFEIMLPLKLAKKD